MLYKNNNVQKRMYRCNEDTVSMLHAFSFILVLLYTIMLNTFHNNYSSFNSLVEFILTGVDVTVSFVVCKFVK